MNIGVKEKWYDIVAEPRNDPSCPLSDAVKLEKIEKENESLKETIKEIREDIKVIERSIEKLFTENLKLRNKVLETDNLQLQKKVSESELDLERERTRNLLLRKNIPFPFVNTPLLDKFLKKI